MSIKKHLLVTQLLIIAIARQNCSIDWFAMTVFIKHPDSLWSSYSINVLLRSSLVNDLMKEISIDSVPSSVSTGIVIGSLPVSRFLHGTVTSIIDFFFGSINLFVSVSIISFPLCLIPIRPASCLPRRRLPRLSPCGMLSQTNAVPPPV